MDFDAQPTLSGDLVALRPLRSEDFDSLFAAASDPEIWDQHPELRSDPVEFRAFFDNRIRAGGALLITDPRTDEVIGTSSYTDFDAAASEIEIGYTFLVRSRWGDGTNTELKRLMLEHAFAQVQNVIFMIGMNNHRSQAAVRKLGVTEIEPRRASTGDMYATFRLTRVQFEAAR